MELYICKHCGNVITYVENSKVPVMCCGSKMEKVEPNTVDAAKEKHLPVFTVENNIVKVSVGSVEHPMVEEHFIKWIILETNKGVQIKYLAPNVKPYAEFAILSDEKVISVTEYCNLHGIWQTK